MVFVLSQTKKAQKTLSNKKRLHITNKHVVFGVKVRVSAEESKSHLPLRSSRPRWTRTGGWRWRWAPSGRPRTSPQSRPPGAGHGRRSAWGRRPPRRRALCAARVAGRSGPGQRWWWLDRCRCCRGVETYSLYTVFIYIYEYMKLYIYYIHIISYKQL